MKYTLLFKERVFHPGSELLVNRVIVSEKDFDIYVQRDGVIISNKEDTKAFSFPKNNIIQLIAEEENNAE
ncbi:hypothetical protein [Salmonella phage F115]|uniref:Uncharacterized protein n=1 Tax=Salmonella phage F61 TaxID=2982033 RepID=A0A977WM18_9CAUD|nr:hypothetical protein [Salmonella phage F115]UXM05410.1 hypothetical protein [Salmonella phage F61]